MEYKKSECALFIDILYFNRLFVEITSCTKYVCRYILRIIRAKNHFKKRGGGVEKMGWHK